MLYDSQPIYHRQLTDIPLTIKAHRIDPVSTTIMAKYQLIVSLHITRYIGHYVDRHHLVNMSTECQSISMTDISGEYRSVFCNEYLFPFSDCKNPYPRQTMDYCKTQKLIKIFYSKHQQAFIKCGKGLDWLQILAQ